jgi:hypothetical protein
MKPALVSFYLSEKYFLELHSPDFPQNQNSLKTKNKIE